MGILTAAVRDARRPLEVGGMAQEANTLASPSSEAGFVEQLESIGQPHFEKFPTAAEGALLPETNIMHVQKEGRSALREVPPDSSFERGVHGVLSPLMADSGEAPGSSATKMLKDSVLSTGQKENAREKSQPKSESDVLSKSMFSRSFSDASLSRPVLSTYAIELPKPSSAKEVFESNRRPDEMALGQHTGSGTPSNIISNQLTNTPESVQTAVESLDSTQSVDNQNQPTTSIQTEVLQTHSEIIRIETQHERFTESGKWNEFSARLENTYKAPPELGQTFTKPIVREKPAESSIRIGHIDVFITAAPTPTRKPMPVSTGSISSKNYLRRA